jgi:hypothetical protein
MILGRILYACLYLFLINKLLRNSVSEAAIFAILVGACSWMVTLDFGIGLYIKKLIITDGGKSSRYKSYLILVKMLILLAIIANYIGSKYISSLILNQSEDQSLYLVLSTLIILSSYVLVLQKVIIGLEKYRLLALISVAPYIISIIIIIFFPHITFVYAALILYAPSIIISLLLSVIIFYPYNFNIRDINGEGIRVCFSFFLLSIIGSIVLSTDFIWIKKLISNTININLVYINGFITSNHDSSNFL